MDRFVHPIGVILSGGALGAVGLPILTMVYEMVAWTVFVPNVDVQALLFLLFVNVPGGALLGGITGFIIACLWEGRPDAAGRTALFGARYRRCFSFVWVGSCSGLPQTRHTWND